MSEWEPRAEIKQRAVRVREKLRENPELYAALLEETVGHHVTTPWVRVRHSWVRYLPGREPGPGGIVAEVVNEKPRTWKTFFYAAFHGVSMTWDSSKEGKDQVDKALRAEGWLLP